MLCGKKILTTFLLWETFFQFSELKEEKQHWTTSKIQYVDTNSLQLPLSRATSVYFSQSEFFFTTAHSGGKNERNVDKWKQRRSVPSWAVRARVRNLALLQDDIMHVITICKSAGIYRTAVWNNFF